MSIIPEVRVLNALDVRGKIGFGGGYGASVYGQMRYGFIDEYIGSFLYGASLYGTARYGAGRPLFGIYQRRLYGAGSTTRDPKKGDRWALSRNRFYPYKITHTDKQNAWRDVFAAGKVQYDLLTAEQLRVLSVQARTLCMSGYNLFMSRWLQSYRS